jgi:hypothetical protein
MGTRLLPLVWLLLLLPPTSWSQPAAVSPQPGPADCPVTRQFQTSTFIPPYPYPAAPGETHFWFGSDRLWTSLPKDGVWGRGRQKLFYFRAGYDARSQPKPDLTVKGRRLDDPTSPRLVTDDHASNGWTKPQQSFMIIGASIPSPGCWEITAKYRTEELTYVVWVAK